MPLIVNVPVIQNSFTSDTEYQKYTRNLVNIIKYREPYDYYVIFGIKLLLVIETQISCNFGR